jgi:hypothetical protein
MVRRDGDEYVAEEWMQGRVGDERLTPGYTGAHLICPSLEELHQRSMRVKSNLTERALKRFQQDDPRILE